MPNNNQATPADIDRELAAIARKMITAGHFPEGLTEEQEILWLQECIRMKRIEQGLNPTTGGPLDPHCLTSNLSDMCWRL